MTCCAKEYCSLPGCRFASFRTVQLLEEFCEAAEPSFFYGCLWECVLASAANRLAGINFVLSHFNRKQSMEDQLFFMGTNLDILVEDSCTLLSSVIVRHVRLVDTALVKPSIHCNAVERNHISVLHTVYIQCVTMNKKSLFFFFFLLFHRLADDEALIMFLQTSLFLVFPYVIDN